MIKASEYIKTGFSANDAECLGAIIEPMVGQCEKIQIDFSNIKIFTTLFFNISLTKYIVQFGPEKYGEMFEVLNLSEVGQSTYQHSFDNAVEYYKLSATQKSEQSALLSDLDED